MHPYYTPVLYVYMFQLKIRGQLTISGVRFAPYYMSHLIVDYCFFMIAGLAFIIGCLAFSVNSFKSAGAILSLVRLQLLCPCIYLYNTQLKIINTLHENMSVFIYVLYDMLFLHFSVNNHHFMGLWRYPCILLR